MAFFDSYPKFYNSSATSASANRLNARHAAIIQGNLDLLRGKRVLDIASHDGRWSFAAIRAGADHVTGIEARPALIENAFSTFAHYGVETTRYAFIQGDVFNVLMQNRTPVDVILCLGYFYHTLRHVELIDLLEQTGASHIILDTEIVRGSLFYDMEDISPRLEGARRVWVEPVLLQLIEEPVELESMAYQDWSVRNDLALVARPSARYIAILMRHFGFSISRVDWRAILSDKKDLHQLNDYVEEWRSTFVCSRL